MQQKRLSPIQRIKFTLIGGCWITGLLLAGSENPMMPWMNILGLFIFFLSGIFLTKGLGRLRGQQYKIFIPKAPVQETVANQRARDRRVSIRFA